MKGIRNEKQKKNENININVANENLSPLQINTKRLQLLQNQNDYLQKSLRSYVKYENDTLNIIGEIDNVLEEFKM